MCLWEFIILLKNYECMDIVERKIIGELDLGTLGDGFVVLQREVGEGVNFEIERGLL